MWHEALEFLGTGILKHVGITDWEEVENDQEYACELFCACSENAPWNTVEARGLAGVDLIKDPSDVLRARSPNPLVTALTPGAMLLLSKVCIKCIEFVW